MRVFSIQIAALALAYACTGWMSLYLAVPPGYTAPLFPPAGIALSALLIFGLRLWPGVLIGALLVQSAALLQTDPGASAIAWLATLLAPLGATLQAVLGSLLARRVIGFPNRLDSTRDIVRFLVVVAPLSAMISASFSLPLLHFAHTVATTDLAFNWWSWWLGDALGMIVATPLMFAFFGEPAADWRPRRFGIAVPMALAIVLLGFALHQVRNWEDLRAQSQFQRDVELIAGETRQRLELQTDMMRSIERLMTVSDSVSRTDFRDFVTPWLERHPGAQNFGWSPLVDGAQRSAFERAVRATDAPGFQILDRENDGRTFPAAIADEYLPITYVEPLERNRSVLGLNPLSLPATAESIWQTRTSAQPVAGEAIRLVQEDGDQRGVVLYLAAFAREPAADGARTLLGVVSGVLRMDDALVQVRDLAHARNIALCLVDRSGRAGNQRLSGALGCEHSTWLDKDLGQRLPVAFAGRHWELRLRTTPEYGSTARSWGSWAMVGLGFAAVGMLGAFLLITTGTSRRTAALVDQRTAELAAAGATLRKQQDALAEAQRIARMGSWECEAGGRHLSASHELRHVLRIPLDAPALTTDALLEAVAETDRPLLAACLARLAHTAERAVLDCRLAGAAPRTVQFLIESARDDAGTLQLRGTVQDVTAARQAEAHIQYLAHYDALTGLPNRASWLAQAHTALRTAQRHEHALAVLFLDLDHFKTVNDSLGHPVGDRLLQTIARRLSACLREEDVLARVGGDEFVTLLPRLTQPDDAATVARKMLEALTHPVRIDGHDLNLSVSIGIAVHPADGSDIDTLLKHADTAMYSAKEAGRDTYQFFTPEMNVRAFERLMLESALRRAVERNELTLHYQPQVDATSGHVSGCEALVRWRHPELGMVPPAHFIPVAEASGLIVALGQWVLREACRQQVRWRQAGRPPLTVAVNISALQFRKTGFTDTVAAILRETGADARHIELEITESALMQPSPELHGQLQRLREMGLTLALDDFGTGYSSLAYLKRLPISRLKIDRSFVRDLPGDVEDAAITAATLSLARDLGLEVVAEGVETQAQYDYLRARGCALVQGFLFSTALPADELMAWIEARP